MPRPRKWKKVCALPGSNLYGPIDEAHRVSQMVIMTVEEFETIRLIDQEGLTQEESAQKMNVARGTIQRLYMDARAKLAESLINGNILKIEGGDYMLSNDEDRRHGCGNCRRNRCGRRIT
ncbi:MAG: DUF134 domain-containing protein [Clostridia bacterium]|nr:DUF134 domain-containing protein [Clostridia bacterium]